MTDTTPPPAERNVDEIASRGSDSSTAGAGPVFLNCRYDGTDHELTVTRTRDEGTRLERCDLHEYTDKDGWRCFRSHDGTVLRMRYDLADPAISCSLVGELMGAEAQGLARATLDEVRNQPGASRSQSRLLT